MAEVPPHIAGHKRGSLPANRTTARQISKAAPRHYISPDCVVVLTLARQSPADATGIDTSYLQSHTLSIPAADAACLAEQQAASALVVRVVVAGDLRTHQCVEKLGQ